MGEPRTAGRRSVRRRFVPADMRRAKVALPNGLTLGNLFFGINAIIAASRGDFDKAVLFVVLGGVCDAFDGAAARATRTGGRFGEELDSLVDAISFGLAPAMIVHFSTLVNGGTGWNWAVFIFAACAVMRLARFNVTQAGASKTYFQGLPSPAAGGTVATYYWFSQTSFYQTNEAIVGLPWGVVMQWLMIILGFLMISSVPYPAWPKVGLRSLKGVLGLAAILFILFGIGYWRRAFFFPFGIAYVTYGLGRAMLLGLWERRPRLDAYTGAPLPPRRGTPRSMSTIAIDPEELEASYLTDDVAVDEEYDFFDDDDSAAPTAARRSGATRAVRTERGERAVRPDRDRAERADRADRADRAERLERKKKRRKKERGEREAREARTDGPVAVPAAPPAPGVAPAGERAERTERAEHAARAERPPRPERPPREPRPDRPPREPVERLSLVEPMDGAGSGSIAGDEEDDGSDDGASRDATGRPDGERRKRRKRRRGNRGALNGEASPTGDAAAEPSFDAGPRDASPPGPVTPPVVVPPPAPPPVPPSAPPSAPSTPPASSPDFREDRSE